MSIRILVTSVLFATLVMSGTLPSAALADMTETAPAANAEDRDFVAGRRAVQDKKWSEAVERFKKVVARDPKNADAFNMLGYASRWLGRMDESFAAYDRALALEPNHRGAHEYIGVAYLRVGKLAKAEEHLAKLKVICGVGCEEYRDLARAIAEHQAKK